nr:MAG TPA: hypothetical protein [Caudoviricetes sp.]
MKKELIIQLVRFHCAVAMQILDQVGDFKQTRHVVCGSKPGLYDNYISLRGANKDFDDEVCVKTFQLNNQRDAYYNQVIDWISKELFTIPKEPKVGYPCLASDSHFVDESCWVYSPELLYIAPSSFSKPYLVKNEEGTKGTFFTYVKALSCVKPLQNANEFTWSIDTRKEEI